MEFYAVEGSFILDFHPQQVKCLLDNSSLKLTGVDGGPPQLPPSIVYKLTKSKTISTDYKLVFEDSQQPPKERMYMYDNEF